MLLLSSSTLLLLLLFFSFIPLLVHAGLLLSLRRPEAWWYLGNVGGGKVGGRPYSKLQCYQEALKQDATYSHVSDPVLDVSAVRKGGVCVCVCLCVCMCVCVL